MSEGRRGLRKGLYLIPSIFTAANIWLGYFAVINSLRGFRAIGEGGEELRRAVEQFDNAARAIGWAVLFDALDGRIARMTRTTTQIGIQLDSMADVLTFGIAPAVLAYTWGYGAAFAEGSDGYKWGWFFSFIYLVCGAFRLARFNVQAMHAGEGRPDRRSFVGLPIPAAAGVIAALVHFTPSPFVVYEPESARTLGWLLMGLLAALAGLMVSTIRYPSFKGAGVRRLSARVLILTLAAASALIWFYSRYILLGAALGYALWGVSARLVSGLRRRVGGERVAARGESD